jgi:hypothetical protein
MRRPFNEESLNVEMLGRVTIIWKNVLTCMCLTSFL